MPSLGPERTCGFCLEGNLVGVLGALTVLACEWYLCYWLFKRRIFIKI